MWTATFTSLWSRKLRLAMSTLAIVLGVSFVSGSLIFADMLTGSFNQILTGSISDVEVSKKNDAVVEAGKKPVPLDDAVIAKVRQVPGVEKAEGTVFEPGDRLALNLAAAVQVLSYELRCAILGDAGSGEGDSARTPPPAGEVAPHAELEGLFTQLAEALEQIDFHKGRAPASAMRKLRRLYLRANLDSAEVRLLRGVLADTQRMAWLAAQGSTGGKIE